MIDEHKIAEIRACDNFVAASELGAVLETLEAALKVVRAAENATIAHGPLCKFPVFGLACDCGSKDLVEALAPFRAERGGE